MLPAEVSADPDYRAGFNREADLAATLWHPHIVSVHDRGEYNRQLWSIATEITSWTAVAAHFCVWPTVISRQDRGLKRDDTLATNYRLNAA